MKHRVIAVVGGTASGKTTFARDLVQALHPDAALLSLDSFYRPNDHLPPASRRRLNFDHPRRMDWPRLEKVLQQVTTGRSARVPRYDFKHHTRAQGTDPVPAKPWLILEGLWVLRRRTVRSHCTMGIFVDCPASERLRRRIRRDREERGRTRDQVLHQWQSQSQPGFRRFVLPQRIHAEVVLHSPVPPDAVRRIVDVIRGLDPSYPQAASARHRTSGFPTRSRAASRSSPMPTQPRTRVSPPRPTS